MPFLPLNQQRQSTEGTSSSSSCNMEYQYNFSADTCSVWLGRGWADGASACPCGWKNCGRQHTRTACHCCGSPYASLDTAQSWNSSCTSRTRTLLEHTNSIITMSDTPELSQSKQSFTLELGTHVHRPWTWVSFLTHVNTCNTLVTNTACQRWCYFLTPVFMAHEHG